MEEVARAQLAAENAEALKESREKAEDGPVGAIKRTVLGEEKSQEEENSQGELSTQKIGSRGKKAIKAYSSFIVSSTQEGKNLSLSA